jgi:hypothetical protein
MREKALRGLWATCVCLTISATAAQAAQGDIVLYAADAIKTAGNWARVSDTTAAGGQKLASADKGWSAGANALAVPNDYVEFTFNAPANTPHRVWLRMRATNNNKVNDSLFVQFSDATTATGTALYRIGTTNALTLNLAQNAGGKMNGWGWIDGAYWLSQVATVSFSTSGAHTLRVQTREDGVQFDQVVISPVTYLSTAPGQVSGDSTIIAKPVAVPTASPTPYTGTAISLPGTFQAEDFDNGGEGLAYHDDDSVNSGNVYRQTGVDLEPSSEGGYDVGWTAAGEWLGYSVNVQAAGSYLLEARVAAPTGGGTFHVEFAGVNVTGTLTVPTTGGWQTWMTVSKVVTLVAGAQQAKVVFDSGAASGIANLNWLRISSATATPYTGSPVALPGTIAVEKFDNGGEGLAYHDNSAGNNGGIARSTDVDLETSSMGTPDIGWIGDGEWVRYSVNVAAAGSYVITAKVASPNTTGKMHVTVGSVATTPVLVPTTGGWQAWQEVSWTATLEAGTQPLTLVFDTGGFNIASVTVAQPVAPAADPAPDPTPAPAPPPTDTGSTTSGNVINVPAGGDLQAAIDKAVGGDTILLAAGATYTGNFRLPAKGNQTDITIATAGTLPPIGTRVTPAMAPQMAKISSGNTSTALATDPYAQHYVIRFIEFLPNTNGYNDVITLGDGSLAQNSLAMVPHDLALIQIYIHGSDATGQKRGVGLNSASTKILDSRIENMWAPGQDSQAICGWNGPGPYEIDNNYLEAASENILFGGATPGIYGVIPSDIRFTRNYVTKRWSWFGTTDRNIKNLFELKAGQRVHVEGNVFENNWAQAQNGTAILFTERLEGGTASWFVITDVLFTNNVVRHVGAGINILGVDDYFPQTGPKSHDIVVRNNLFEDVNGAKYGSTGRFAMVRAGYGYTFDHNTILQDGASYLYGGDFPAPYVTFTNNIVQDLAWGVMGAGTAPGTSSLTTWYPNATFLRNVSAGSNAATYPQGNFYPASMTDVGFVNYVYLTGGNYRLSSTSIYKGAGTDGKDLGADLNAINAAAGTSY